MNQEVKRINGYDLKDETARNNIKIVDDRINEEVKFIFPKNFTNSYSADCNLIQYKDKNIMIDTYNSNCYQDIVNMLQNYNINHLDYVILTHYHSDHIGNFENLVDDNYITNTTKLYFPSPVTKFEDYASLPSQYQQYCIQHNLTYYVPEEYEELKIGELILTFFNCNSEILDDLYYDNASYKNYNNCSTVVKVNYRNTQALYTGDCLKLAIDRIYNEKFVKGEVDLYKIEHHGIEPNTNINFIRSINPKYSFQTSGIMDYQKKTLFTRSEVTKVLEDLNCRNYVMFEQDDYVEFVTKGNEITCIIGVPGNISKSIVEETYYVNKDAEQGVKVDGSINYPFNEINQALGIIENNPATEITLNLADGLYGKPELEYNQRSKCYISVGKETKVIINGNENDNTKVILNGVYVKDSNIVLNNLTIDVDTYEGINAFNSNVVLNNVRITSLTNTQSNKSCIILRDNSSCIIKNSYIDYGNEGIIVTDSYLNIDSITVGTHFTSRPFNFYNSGCNVITKDISYDVSSDKLNNNFNRKVTNTPQLVYSGSTFNDDITLSKSIGNFDWVEIIYGNSNGLQSSGRIYGFNGVYTFLTINTIGADGTLYAKYCRVKILNNKLTIDRCRQINHSGNGHTVSEEGEYIVIQKVIAGFNDYVDYTS